MSSAQIEVPAVEPATEALTLHLISSLSASDAKPNQWLGAFTKLLRRLPGVEGIRLDWNLAAVESLGSTLTAARSSGRTSGAVLARAPIGAGRNIWGELRLYFTLDQFDVESPARLAAFAGQQLGLWATRLHQQSRQALLRRQLAQLQEELALGKVLARAVGILSVRESLPPMEARQRLERVSLRDRRSLRDVAESVVLRPDTWSTAAPSSAPRQLRQSA